jgi:hypothetical protein
MSGDSSTSVKARYHRKYDVELVVSFQDEYS